MPKRKYPPHWWHLNFIGGKLNGQVKRHPSCPTRWAHDGQEYRLMTRQETKLSAEYVKCKG